MEAPNNPPARLAGEAVGGGSAVGPAPAPQSGGVRRAKVPSEEVCLGLLEPEKGRLSPHAERRTRGLGDLEHGSAWRDNGKVWVTWGYEGVLDAATLQAGVGGWGTRSLVDFLS